MDWSWLILGGIFAAYMLPTIVAAGLHHRNLFAIFALNCLAGWTGRGWVSAMVWALTTTSSRHYRF